MPLSSSAFDGAVWALAAVYAVVCLWSIWKLAVFSSVSWAWTGQKTIHACTALAAAARAAFFFLLTRNSQYFFIVQVTSDDAPFWLYVMDELPSVLLLGVLSVLTLTWASSYYGYHRLERFYRRRVLVVFWALFGALVAGQIAIWACYGHLRSSADVLSVAEGSMYALAFFVAGVAAAVFGQRTSCIALSVPLLGLSSRKLLNRKIMLQTVICAAAFASRALASLGAAIAAATGVDDRWSEDSVAGVVATLFVFVCFDITPAAVILLQNRRALGHSRVPGPAKIIRPCLRGMVAPCSLLCNRLLSSRSCLSRRQQGQLSSASAGGALAEAYRAAPGLASESAAMPLLSAETASSNGSGAISYRTASSSPRRIGAATAAAAGGFMAAAEPSTSGAMPASSLPPMSPGVDAAMLLMASGAPRVERTLAAIASAGAAGGSGAGQPGAGSMLSPLHVADDRPPVSPRQAELALTRGPSLDGCALALESSDGAASLLASARSGSPTHSHSSRSSSRVRGGGVGTPSRRGERRPVAGDAAAVGASTDVAGAVASALQPVPTGSNGPAFPGLTGGGAGLRRMTASGSVNGE